MRQVYQALFTLVLFFAVQLHAAGRPPQFSGDIYDLEGKDVKFKFDYRQETKGDTKVAHSKYSSASGEELVVERTEFKGDQLVSYEQTQKQLGSEGKIRVENNKILFSYKRDGKEKTDDEDLVSNFVTTSGLVDYIGRNFEALKRGDSIDVRVGVVDRRETVGFTLKKEKELEINGQKGIQIRLKPSSFVIAAIVRPIYFTLSEDGSRALELRGRLPVKVKVDGQWKDYDGRMVYKY